MIMYVGCATLSVGYDPFEDACPESYEGKEKTNNLHIYIYH